MPTIDPLAFAMPRGVDPYQLARELAMAGKSLQGPQGDIYPSAPVVPPAPSAPQAPPPAGLLVGAPPQPAGLLAPGPYPAQFPVESSQDPFPVPPQGQGGTPADPGFFEQLLEGLNTPEGRDRLFEALAALAPGDPSQLPPPPGAGGLGPGNARPSDLSLQTALAGVARGNPVGPPVIPFRR